MSNANPLAKGCIIGITPVIGAAIGFSIGTGSGNVSFLTAHGMTNLMNGITGALAGGLTGLIIGLIIVALLGSRSNKTFTSQNDEPKTFSNDFVEEAVAKPSGKTPNNWMIASILATIFCCLPFGIVAIVYANSVNNHLKNGDLARAEAASKNAKTWLIVSVSIGLLFGSISLIPTIFELL